MDSIVTTWLPILDVARLVTSYLTQDLCAHHSWRLYPKVTGCLACECSDSTPWTKTWRLAGDMGQVSWQSLGQGKDVRTTHLQNPPIIWQSTKSFIGSQCHLCEQDDFEVIRELLTHIIVLNDNPTLPYVHVHLANTSLYLSWHKGKLSLRM